MQRQRVPARLRLGRGRPPRTRSRAPWYEDGRGESIWDRFCAVPGRGADRRLGRRGVRLLPPLSAKTSRLMRELGLDAFRFSISWPRDAPGGPRPRRTSAGLDFYDRLVDALLEAGIRPFATLYHWDLPQALEEEGGWPVRADRGGVRRLRRARRRERLGDRVNDWTTHNEPFCTSWLGYGIGVHAPGRRDVRDRARGRAPRRCSRTAGRSRRCAAQSPGAEVGIVLDSWPIHPGERLARGREAACGRGRRAQPPLLRPALPRHLSRGRARALRRLAPPVRDGDLAAIAVPARLRRASTTTRARIVRAGPDGETVDVALREGRSSPTWAGRCTRPRLVRVARPAAREYAVSAALRDRERRRIRRRPRPRRPRPRRRAGRVPARYTRRGRRRDRGGVPGARVLRLVAARQLRVGASATRSGSGSSTSTTPTLERVPKDSFAWYREAIARSRGVAVPAAARP